MTRRRPSRSLSGIFDAATPKCAESGESRELRAVVNAGKWV